MAIQSTDIIDAIDEAVRARSLCQALFLALEAGLPADQGEPFGQLLVEIQEHIMGAHNLLEKYHVNGGD